MYNNFLVEKNKKIHDRQTLIDKRMTKWLENYHSKVKPQLINGYTQRINTFITKLQENPKQLNKFQAPDVRKQKQDHLREKISEMSRKGGRIFRFRDTTDFNSFYEEAERAERLKNKSLFEKRFGDPRMAFRSIASQSSYVSEMTKEFRNREKQKEINPPMKYTNKISPALFVHRKSKSVIQPRKNKIIKTQTGKQQETDHDIIRRSTSVTNSVFGDELNKSVKSIKQSSDSSEDSYKNLKKLSIQLKNPNKQKKKESNKSYFVGITDVKQNSKDPHFKKTLHNILVKVGKTHPNSRDKTLMSHVQVLSNEIN